MNETERPEALRFENLMKKVDANKDNSPLPKIDIAMFEDDVAFRDDLSSSKKYNNRYVELDHVGSVRGSFMLYLSFLLHNVFLIFLVFAVADRDFFGVLIALIAPIVFWIMMAVAAVGVWGGGVRFNRQAQLVHIGKGPGKALTISWRDVSPYFSHNVLGGDLFLYFPIPEGEFDKWSAEDLKKVYSDGPVFVSGHMDWRDPGFSSSLMRLEFYRRYMEKGLDAVQPDPDKVGEANIQPPSPAQQSLPEHGFLLHRVINPMQKIGSFLAGGPLIDRFLRKQAKKFYWPEEVERLCAPGADLSGLDTRPVIPRKDIFYRARTMAGIEYVNARGEPAG